MVAVPDATVIAITEGTITVEPDSAVVAVPDATVIPDNT